MNERVNKKICSSIRIAKPIIDQWHNMEETIVFTNGCFDIFHAGHAVYLNEAKSKGDKLIVALNSDASVQRLKGMNRPIMEVKNRATVLASLSSVDLVIVFQEDSPIKLINYIKPQYYAKGGDYKLKDLKESNAIMDHNGKVVILSYIENLSSTKIINTLNLNNDS